MSCAFLKGHGLALLLLGLALASLPADAATLDWNGTVFVSVGGGSPIVLTGQGVATVNGSGGTGALQTLRIAGGITGAASVPPVTPSALIQTVTVTATLGTGTLKPFTGSGPLTQNVLPVPGSARISLLFPACSFACLTIPLTQGGIKGVGIGGQIVTGSGPTISINGAPWTRGVAKVTFTQPTASGGVTTLVLSTTGFAHGPGSGTSTAQNGGVIQIVTPTLVDSTISSQLPILSALRIAFVPEPSLLLMLVPGIGLLALLGLGRRR